MTNFIKVNEITKNPKFAEQDMLEMAFYVKQTFDRYLVMINSGYDQMETIFGSEEEITATQQFQIDDAEMIEYASTTLSRNLKMIYDFCFSATDKDVFLTDPANRAMYRGYTNGGLNDFLSETMSPCLSFHSLAENGVMDTYYDRDSIHRLFITFFAQLKLHFGSLLKNDGCPVYDLHYSNVCSLGVHEEHFSFRELTLLGGFQTERAVRNLASPSTPEHRRLSVVKEGRNTYVTHSEALRWLASTGRI